MAKSVLVIEADDQGRFSLSVAAGVLTLGDPEHADALLGELRVTRIRCEVEVADDSVVVRKPGTGGQPGIERKISAGQGVRVGNSRLRLEAIGEEEDAPTEADEVAPDAPAAEGTFKRLRVIDGADLGRAFRLPLGGTVSVGKSAKHADIVLHDLYVSRVHCTLGIEGGSVLVRHTEGDNGTLINGKRIAGEQELHLGDVLRIGNSHLRLETALTLDNTPQPEEEEGAIATADGAEEAPEEAHELTAQVLGHYRIAQLLGKGHSGEVFRAQDLRSNLVVALKILPLEFPADGQELQRFAQAMKAVTQIHHPNLVAVHTAGRSGTRCWIAREYVAGQGVAALANRSGGRKKMDWTLAARAAVHLARALNFLHKQRIVHGNVTPANVLIGEDGKARLADLMLANALEGSRLQEAMLEQKLLAELPYLAPEQTESGAFVDHLADLYGLGAVAYTLLTGGPPFAGGSPAEIIERVRNSQPERPSAQQRGVPAEFEAVVLKLMAKHQEDRYQTASQVLAAVDAITEGHKIEV